MKTSMLWLASYLDSLIPLTITYIDFDLIYIFFLIFGLGSGGGRGGRQLGLGQLCITLIDNPISDLPCPGFMMNDVM